MRCVSLLMCLLIMTARAGEPAPEALEVTFNQKIGTRLPREAMFRDEMGEQRALGDFFTSRPVILVLGYYECPMLCQHMNAGLLNVLRALEFDVGDRFDVLHVSIDPEENPSIALAKKRNFLSRYQRQGSESAWHLLTGSESAIRSVTDAVGFDYRYDAASGEYAHPSGLVILTPDARVSSYLFGIQFPPGDLRVALEEAGDGAMGSPIERLLLLCYRYNPIQGKYGRLILDGLRFLSLAAVFALGILIIRSVRRERRRIS